MPYILYSKFVIRTGSLFDLNFIILGLNNAVRTGT